MKRLQLAAAIALGLAGAWAAVTIAGTAGGRMGPFDVRLRASFGAGRTEIVLLPLGRVSARTHAPPLHLSATLEDVNVEGLPKQLEEKTTAELASDVESDARAELPGLALQVILAGLAGAFAAGFVAFRTRWRLVAVSVVTALAVVAGSVLVAWRTFDTSAFAQPRFSGSLRLAPRLVGPVRQITGTIDAFRAELRQIVSGAVQAYSGIEAASRLRGDETAVLHISDIHLSPVGIEFAVELARGFDVDAVIDTGDLTSYGTPVESLILTQIPRFERPYVFVRGNHDSTALAEQIARIKGAHVLDDGTLDIAGLTIYGLAHPAFTEDKTQPVDHPSLVEAARGAGATIAAALASGKIDVVAVHDDRMAQDVAGDVPLVVSGHFHKAARRTVDGTLFLRAGSTGGSGINTLRSDTPLSANILYFRNREHVAWDVVEQDPRTGRLVVERHLADEEPEPSPSPSLEPTP